MNRKSDVLPRMLEYFFVYLIDFKVVFEKTNNFFKKSRQMKWDN